jgi:hypothetical protein
MNINFKKYVIETGLQKLEENKKDCNWLATYGFVSNLIEKINAKSVAEVGVAYGYHAEYLLERHKDIDYFGIDPYLPGYDPRDAFASDVARIFPESSGRSMDVLYACVYINFLNHFGRGTLIRKKSAHAADFFADGSLDLVYIDGDHRPESVQRDLECWFPKVRLGGIICGDDFNYPGASDVITNFFVPFKCPIVGYTDNTGTIVKWAVDKMPSLANP